MKLPDNFWSVNEDEPGIGGLIAGFAVFVLFLLAVLVYVVMFTPVPA